MPLRMWCIISSQSDELISDFLKSCPAQEKSSLIIAMPKVATYLLISHLKITTVYCAALFMLFPLIDNLEWDPCWGYNIFHTFKPSGPNSVMVCYQYSCSFVMLAHM